MWKVEVGRIRLPYQCRWASERSTLLSRMCPRPYEPCQWLVIQSSKRPPSYTYLCISIWDLTGCSFVGSDRFLLTCLITSFCVIFLKQFASCPLFDIIVGSFCFHCGWSLEFNFNFFVFYLWDTDWALLYTSRAAILPQPLSLFWPSKACCCWREDFVWLSAKRHTMRRRMLDSLLFVDNWTLLFLRNTETPAPFVEVWDLYLGTATCFIVKVFIMYQK